MTKTKLNSSIVSLVALSVFPLNVNQSSLVATYTICVDKQASSSSSGGSFKTGHVFLRVTNESNNDFVIGYHTLQPDETVTIGLFDGQDGIPQGVFYNREVYRFNKGSYPSPEHYIEQTYYINSLNEINAISDVINEHNLDYNLLFYNCISLVIDATNAIFDIDFGSIPFPTQMYNYLKEHLRANKNTFDPYQVSEFYQYPSGLTYVRSVYYGSDW